MTPDDVFAMERAFVAAGLARTQPPAGIAAGAVASRYLAVGTPRSIGLVGAAAACRASLEAHRTWFAPRDIRGTEPLELDGARVVGVDEALACDIVCIHAPLAIASAQLRRGTHVNIFAPVELAPELHTLATIVDGARLARMAAGLEDGRQLDEITIYID